MVSWPLTLLLFPMITNMHFRYSYRNQPPCPLIKDRVPSQRSVGE